MTTTTTARGFALTCPHCQEEQTLRLDLADLDTIKCNSCDEETTVTEMRRQVGEWLKLFAWIESAPAAE